MAQMQEDMDVFTMDHKDLPRVDPEEILDEIESDFSQQVTPQACMLDLNNLFHLSDRFQMLMYVYN